MRCLPGGKNGIAPPAQFPYRINKQAFSSRSLSELKQISMAKRVPCEKFRVVDMWAVPGMHSTNVEFLQRLRTADSQHFTKNMDAVGTVSEKNAEGKKEKTHLIGLRTDIWKPDSEDVAETLEHLKERRQDDLRREIKRSGRLNAKQKIKLQAQVETDKVMQMCCEDIEHRRLVMKLFKTSTDRTNWVGTLEQLTTNEVYNSMGSNRSLITMAVMLPRYEYVTYIQQNHRTMRIPSIYSFGFYDEGRMWHVLLRRKWISVGADYDIIADCETIGSINGLLFALGSDSRVNLCAHSLGRSAAFLNLITLFASSVGYHSAMRRSIAKRVKSCKAGNWHEHVIDADELRLRKNGRAA